jgi:hypothetical protein
VPFCLPNLAERKKKAFLSKIVEAKELNPKRVLVRVEHELQEAGLYVPFYKPSTPTISNGDGSALQSNDRLQALVGAARGMREAKLLVDDPMRRAEMGISEEGLIEQIETDGDAARDDRKESFLFMLSEEAKAQKAKRRIQAKYVRPAEPAGNEPSEESDATAAAEVVRDRSASSQAEGSAVSEVAAEGESTRQVGFLLANESSLGRSNDQEAHCVLQWNGVVQAELCKGVESCASDTLETGLVGSKLPGGNKWEGGVLAADGNIYGIPHSATQVLRFDPRTQQATLVGDQLPGGDLKWHGGVLAADGNIYGIPLFAVQVLRFDPRTQQATLVGNQLPGGAKWHGGVLAADGNIYGIPHEATQVLRLAMDLPKATAELVLELDAQSSKYARLKTHVENLPPNTETTLRLDACGCGAYVRLVPQVGFELGMGQIGISVTIERKATATDADLDAAPATAAAAAPADEPACGSSAFAAGSAQPAPAPVVLLTAEARYKIKLPEARFGIAENSSYAPMMDENERDCLERLCPFADGNPRRLKRIINVFNVGRRVVELRRGKEWSGLAAFKPKLLKFVILLEQWPYRAPVRLK